MFNHKHPYTPTLWTLFISNTFYERGIIHQAVGIDDSHDSYAPFGFGHQDYGDEKRIVVLAILLVQIL